MRFNQNKLLGTLLLALAQFASATTWYVNGVTGSDSNNCMSSTTACKTIGHANSLAASGDTIVVAPATYTESLGIGKDLTILGSGATTTIIDGGGVATVVGISSFSAHVTLTDMTIRNGAAPKYVAGGGVENLGVLTLTRCIVSGNTAFQGGGLYNNGGTLTINYSTISGNALKGTCNFCFIGGGGIYNQGVLTVNNSTISDNNPYTKGGGGIATNGHTVTISKSTVSDNMAGGGIFSINGAKVMIINSTVSGNNGGGIGVIGVGGKVTISNGTVSGNGGGIGVHGTGSKATLQNSIVANNSGGNCSGSITSNGYNLSSDGSCPFTNTGDLNNTNPLLGPLQNNGGPTQTQGLLSGSPAIDSGRPGGCRDAQTASVRVGPSGSVLHPGSPPPS